MTRKSRVSLRRSRRSVRKSTRSKSIQSKRKSNQDVQEVKQSTSNGKKSGSKAKLTISIETQSLRKEQQPKNEDKQTGKRKNSINKPKERVGNLKAAFSKVVPSTSQEIHHFTKDSESTVKEVKKSLRRSKRLSKIMDLNSNKEDEIVVEPMAASSPMNARAIDSDDEECLNQARQNLEAIKREIVRQARLLKFKLGSEILNQPFSKRWLAKNYHVCYKKGIEKPNETLAKTVSGFNTMSFTTLASSTKYPMKNGDKNTSSDRCVRVRNDISVIQSTKNQSARKEITLNENTFEASNPIPSTSKLEIQLTSKEKETIESAPSTSSSYPFKTPSVMSLRSNRQIALVTPGPQVNNPLSVFRRPLAGEVAISLFGSPLLVAPDCAPTNMPQINLPTADGKVLSILPRAGFTIDDLPSIATPTRHQLRTLNKYLSDMCNDRKN